MVCVQRGDFFKQCSFFFRKICQKEFMNSPIISNFFGLLDLHFPGKKLVKKSYKKNQKGLHFVHRRQVLNHYVSFSRHPKWSELWPFFQRKCIQFTSVTYAWKKGPWFLYPTPLIEWVEHTQSLLVKMKMSALCSHYLQQMLKGLWIYIDF